MIYLWVLGAVFLFINLFVVLCIFAEIIAFKISRAFGKKDQEDKPLFNLPIAGIAYVLFVMSLMVNFLVPAINQARSSGSVTQDDLVIPDFVPFNPGNDWPMWGVWGFIFGSSISVSLFGAFYVWLIRCMLPKKYKPCITWLKPKDE